MSVKTRAAARLAKHLVISLGSMIAIYVAFTFMPADVFLMILGGTGLAFFSYQLFKIYVSMEEMAENRKK